MPIIRNFTFPNGSRIPIAVLLIVVRSFAGSAELHGTVLDPAGAVLPHAEVKLFRGKTQLAQARTDEGGARLPRICTQR